MMFITFSRDFCIWNTHTNDLSQLKREEYEAGDGEWKLWVSETKPLSSVFQELCLFLPFLFCYFFTPLGTNATVSFLSAVPTDMLIYHSQVTEIIFLFSDNLIIISVTSGAYILPFSPQSSQLVDLRSEVQISIREILKWITGTKITQCKIPNSNYHRTKEGKIKSPWRRPGSVNLHWQGVCLALTKQWKNWKNLGRGCCVWRQELREEDRTGDGQEMARHGTAKPEESNSDITLLSPYETFCSSPPRVSSYFSEGWGEIH